jgi:hypothetical protein
MVDVGALDMNAKIGRAQYCESAAFFAMCLPHVDEAPLPMSGEDELLLRVGAVEGALFVVDRDVDADLSKMAETVIDIPPISPAALRDRLGFDVAFEGVAGVVKLAEIVDAQCTPGGLASDGGPGIWLTEALGCPRSIYRTSSYSCWSTHNWP